MDGNRVPELGEELAVIANPRSGKPESVIVPIAAWNALPNEVRETLNGGRDVDFAMKGDRRIYALVYWHAYERIREDIEDAIDVLAYDRAKAAQQRDPSGSVPLEVLRATEDGTPPLVAWRKHRGMTQAELAEASGVERSYIAHIEKGTRQGTAETLARLAKPLGCSVDDLIDG